MKKNILILVCLCSMKAFAQSEKINIIEDVYKCDVFWYGYFFKFTSNDTIRHINDTSFLKIDFKDSLKNNAIIEVYDIFRKIDTVKIAKLSYFNNKDTLFYYFPVLDQDGEPYKYDKWYYFHLMPNGECLFWNNNNILIRKEYWKNGTLEKKLDIW